MNRAPARTGPTRRRLLQAAAVLPLAGQAVPALARAAEAARRIADGPDWAAKPVDLFSDEQRTLLVALTETILPATETPGAAEAGVATFIERMVAEWMTPEEREAFVGALATFAREVQRRHGKAFAELDQDTREDLLTDLEEQASDHPWYALGNIDKDYEADAPFICQLKELTVFGFFTSEVGATQVLRYSAMPGYFDPDVPLAWTDPSWAPVPEV